MKAKRLVALLMAIMLIVGIVAIPASAADIVCYTCKNIDGDGTQYTYSTVAGYPETVNPKQVTGCSQMTGYHYHYDRRTLYQKKCAYHGDIGTYYTLEYDLCFGG